MAARHRERSAQGYEADSLQNELLFALSHCAIRATAIRHNMGGQVSLRPEDTPLMAVSSNNYRGIQQELRAIISPPSGGLLGVISVTSQLETGDCVPSIVLSHLAKEPEQRAVVAKVLRGDEIVHHRGAAVGDPSWEVGIHGSTVTDMVTVMHAGEGHTELITADDLSIAQDPPMHFHTWSPASAEIQQAIDDSIRLS